MAERKKGRPNKYTKKLGDEICERLAEGESLRSICRDDDKPSKSSVFRWLLAHDDKNLDSFRDQYTHAREIQAEGIFDEVLDIADNSANDWMTREIKGGLEIEVPNSEVIRRSEIRINTRFKVLARMLPRKYGDLVSKDGEPTKQALEPLQLNVKAKLAKP